MAIFNLYAKYISQMISNTAMVTTIVDNRIFMICCTPTFLRYRAIIHALLSRAYLSVSYFLLLSYATHSSVSGMS